MTSIEKLIDATLHGTNIGHAGAHVISNDAGLQLIAASQDHLLTIEERFALMSRDSAGLELFGIDYFVGAYLVGSVRKNRVESFEFLRTLPPDWIRCVVGSVSAFFRVTRFGFSCQVEPNDQLKAFLNWCCEHDDCQVAEIAREVKEELDRPIPVWPSLEGKRFDFEVDKRKQTNHNMLRSFFNSDLAGKA